LIATALHLARRWRKQPQLPLFAAPIVQFVLWITLYTGALLYLFSGKEANALLLLLCAQLFPRAKRVPPEMEKAAMSTLGSA